MLCKKEKPRFTCLVGFIHKNYYNLETNYWQKAPDSELVQYIPFARELCDVLDKWE